MGASQLRNPSPNPLPQERAFGSFLLWEKRCLERCRRGLGVLPGEPCESAKVGCTQTTGLGCIFEKLRLNEGDETRPDQTGRQMLLILVGGSLKAIAPDCTVRGLGISLILLMFRAIGPYHS